MRPPPRLSLCAAWVHQHFLNLPHFQTLSSKRSSTSVTAGDLLTKAPALHSHQDCGCRPRLPGGRAAAALRGPWRAPAGSVTRPPGGVWREEAPVKADIYRCLQLSPSSGHWFTSLFTRSFTQSPTRSLIGQVALSPSLALSPPVPCSPLYFLTLAVCVCVCVCVLGAFEQNNLNPQWDRTMWVVSVLSAGIWEQLLYRLLPQTQ